MKLPSLFLLFSGEGERTSTLFPFSALAEGGSEGASNTPDTSPELAPDTEPETELVQGSVTPAREANGRITKDRLTKPTRMNKEKKFTDGHHIPVVNWRSDDPATWSGIEDVILQN